MQSRHIRRAAVFASLLALTSSCSMDRAPRGLRQTPEGPGAKVRFDLAHRPLPDIPLPNDTATWPDPTSRTGLRVNASVIAPTSMEQKARDRFTELEGWGTFSPITVAFDVDRAEAGYEGYTGPALDLVNITRRHHGDDYDFADDAVYVINLATGVPAVLDLGQGNFDYTLRSLDKYWPNDTRATERNLLFDTIDESRKGEITPETFLASDDTDFDGVLDIPNLDDLAACPDPDPVCDNPADPGATTDACVETRRARDRCITDHLLTFYERETDTLVMRPLLPLDEMTRYAVVVTDRTIDGRGNPVKSPFEFIYHASMETTARRVADVLNDPAVKSYYGDLHGTGLDHVAFTWSFTTQPTVDDLKKLRDGLYGTGPFARWATEFPARVELARTVGLVADVNLGAQEDPSWATSQAAKDAKCPIDGSSGAATNLHILRYDDVKDTIKTLVTEGFGMSTGPGTELLLTKLDSIDYMVLGTFKAPFLLEGGPSSTDPNAAFRLSYATGEGEVHEDAVPFWLIVPKATATHKQPFDVNIYGHGYTGNFSEQLLYAGNMAQHGLATVGINAMGHGLSFNAETATLAKGLLGGACAGPFYNAVTLSRARDIDSDGEPDSGGDFWSSYIFHTRDGVRQSVLDHIQLVRALRAFGDGGSMLCRDAEAGWDKPASKACDLNADGKPEVAGDFNADGTPDVGGPSATYGTWGESLGGILSAIHGAVDPYVTTAVPGSGGGGLIDIGVRSFQGGVVEAVLLRLWGPLLVTVPGAARSSCDAKPDDARCTLCDPEEVSLRWVVPDVNRTGEIEIGCFSAESLKNTTALVVNQTSGEIRCASMGDDPRLRVGVPSSVGDKVLIEIYGGRDTVKDYTTCELLPTTDLKLGFNVTTWGKGRIPQGTENALGTATCASPTCSTFHGQFFGEGDPLTAPAEGLGLIRQTPALRRFLALAQAALDPGDPVSFAPYYAVKPMTDPAGKVIAPHAVLTLNTVGDMNVPLNAGIAFARATGALPFLRPDQAALYPAYADYATPAALYDALGGRTPNQDLIENHVIEGITQLARHPAAPECLASANAKPADGTFMSHEGEPMACFPACPATECYEGSHCDTGSGVCVPNGLSKATCDEALFDPDNIDEGTAGYHEEDSKMPHRLARFTEKASPESLDAVWAPRLLGAPFGQDGAYGPDPARPLTALLDAYVVPQGTHTFVNGEPCQSFDVGTYLTNLTARFFMTDGSDLYYLSHPATHHCLGEGAGQCGYLDTSTP